MKMKGGFFMKNAKIFLAVLVVIFTIFTGCTNQEVNENEEGVESENASQIESDSEKPKDPITVSFTGWYDESNMENVIKEINNQLNGEIIVEYTFVNLQQYNNVLSTQLAAGEGPDIITDGASFPARIKAGNLVEITGEDFLRNFNDAGLSLSSVDGKIYGIPSYGWYSGLWYNKTIFEENNIKVPETFDELVEACEQLNANGIQPLGFGLSDGDTAFHSLVGYLENDFYHNGGKGEGFDSKFAFGEEEMSGVINEYIKEWSILIDKGFINESMLGISNDQALAGFISGKTAMFNSGPWHYNTIKESGIEFGMISHLGSHENNKWLVGGPAANYGINANTKKIDAAMKVLEAMGGQEVQQAILDSNTGAFSYYVGLVPEIPEEYAAIEDVLSKGNVGVCWDRWGVNMPAQAMIDEAVKQLQGVIAGSTSVDDYVNALDQKADAIRYAE